MTKHAWNRPAPKAFAVCTACGYVEGDLADEYQLQCEAGLPQVSPQATVRPLNVTIKSLPHSEQRYDTCGDWLTTNDDRATLAIYVSQLANRREMFLVAIHELIEAFLCECTGVTEKQVDEFDLNFDSNTTPGNDSWKPDFCEPGDDPRAPYYYQHQIATGIERILAAEVGVGWLEYEKHIKELSR